MRTPQCNKITLNNAMACSLRVRVKVKLGVGELVHMLRVTLTDIHSEMSGINENIRKGAEKYFEVTEC